MSNLIQVSRIPKFQVYFEKYYTKSIWDLCAYGLHWASSMEPFSWLAWHDWAYRVDTSIPYTFESVFDFWRGWKNLAYFSHHMLLFCQNTVFE